MLLSKMLKSKKLSGSTKSFSYTLLERKKVNVSVFLMFSLSIWSVILNLSPTDQF